MRIQVNQLHIAQGTRHSRLACPIALACRSHQIPVIVSSNIIYIEAHIQTRNGKKFWIQGSRKTLNRKMRSFISDFDSGLPVQPFFSLSQL